jgi:hypothetical protein
VSDAFERSISGIELNRVSKKAFNVLGYSGIDALVSDLENHGVALDSEKKYLLKEIYVVLQKLFGDIADLMMERMLREIS